MCTYQYMKTLVYFISFPNKNSDQLNTKPRFESWTEFTQTVLFSPEEICYGFTEYVL